MQVKTFKAVDMPEALRMVKSEFGPDAMILSSRSERRKGLLGRFYKPHIEVTATPNSTHRDTHVPQPERGKNQPSTLDIFQKSMLAPMARELKELRARVDTLTARQTGAACLPPSTPQSTSQAYRRSDWESPDVKQASSVLPGSEVEGLKKVLLRYLEKPDASGQESPGRQLEKLSGGNEPQEVTALAAELRAIGVEEEVISHLAALEYHQGVTVSLINIDTFQVGVVIQLQTHSDIMDMPMEIASMPGDPAEAIALMPTTSLFPSPPPDRVSKTRKRSRKTPDDSAEAIALMPTISSLPLPPPDRASKTRKGSRKLES